MFASVPLTKESKDDRSLGIFVVYLFHAHICDRAIKQGDNGPLISATAKMEENSHVPHEIRNGYFDATVTNMGILHGVDQGKSA